MSKHKQQAPDLRPVQIGNRIELVPVNRAARRAFVARGWQNRPNKGKPGNKARARRGA